MHRLASRLPLILLVIAALWGCQEKDGVSSRALELSDFRTLVNPNLRVDAQKVRRHIGQLVRSDRDTTLADAMTRDYYDAAAERPLVWISRLGADDRADTLLVRLAGVGRMGFSPRRFAADQIKSDLSRLRTLDFSDSVSSRHADINHVVARLEYNLTKAYFRYAVGQHFGFTNPRYLLNHFDVKEGDSTRVEYHRLFDVPMRRPNEAFFSKALRMLRNDSLADFLAAVEPRHPLYRRLEAQLGTDSVSLLGRAKILCNMERCRWQLLDQPFDHKKYVFVNVPAYKLYAVDGDSVLSMRVGCGTTKTKTPLLSSRIKRIDVNPQWIIPRSIVEKDIVRHVGDADWFDHRRYFVRNRKTGQNVPIEHVTAEMLRSTDYLVIQEGGAGNSLGRIIFRFDNNFSVFLHDTSSPGFFSRDDRGVSHGCVRVQRPFDLAVFLLDDKAPDLIRKIDYSMRADVSHLGSNRRRQLDETDNPRPEQPDTLDRSLLITSHKLQPEVPVYISYFTICVEPGGTLRPYADVYGFDGVLYQQLKNYVP